MKTFQKTGFLPALINPLFYLSNICAHALTISTKTHTCLKALWITGILFILQTHSFAQDTLAQAGGTCNDANVICTKNTLVVLSSANGSSDPTPDAVRANSPSCFGRSRNQSTFLKFTVKQTGLLHFTIVSLDNATEYDWALYEFSGCGNNLQNPPGEIVCNYFDNSEAGSPGWATGMCDTGNADGTEAYSLEVQVDAGKTYLMLIDNYTSNGVGYSITWGGTFDIAPDLGFTINNSPLTDTICCAPATVSFQNTTTYPGTFSWDLGNGQTSGQQNPGDQVYLSGTYTISLDILTTDNCTYSFSKDLTVRSPILPEPAFYLYIPDAFSPNNDGINDELRITSEGIDEFRLNVFNRWGELVYTSEDITETWKDDLLPGIYVYKVFAKDLSGKLYDQAGTIAVLK